MLFKRHHTHRLKVNELPPTCCVHGFAEIAQHRSLKDFTHIYHELRPGICLKFSGQKSERLHTHLPRTQSVVNAVHNQDKPEGLEYEALLI